MIFSLAYSYAQSSSTLMGARAASLANASSGLEDEWSLFNNIGGIAGVKKTTSAFSYDVHPSLQAFNRIAALIAVPVKIGVMGIGAYRFGDDLYNEQLINVGIGNRFGIASLGAKVSYIQYHAEGFGNKSVITVSCGGIAQLTKQLSVGAHITNINQPRIATSSTTETLPTILTMGLTFKPGEKLLLATEIEKEVRNLLSWKNGVEYQFHKKFSFRTGFRINPNTAYMGFGFNPKRFSLAYAIGHNFNIGTSHQVSVIYVLAK